ncbi:proteasome maturation factor UMP1-domain-containing protein [Dichotomocladium elegans]|nr:proteasome maturation factor UMP1-domain-containing protein [Dichotomocladium elegans]
MSLRIAPSAHPESNTKSTFDTTHAEFGGHDTLRYGTRSIKSEVLPGHPIEERLNQWAENQWELKLNMARNIHGMHAPIKMMMERDIVSKRQRMPVLPSSNLHLDILMGKDETIDFEDFLNDPAMSTDFLDVHAAMEHKLNLKV